VLCSADSVVAACATLPRRGTVAPSAETVAALMAAIVAVWVLGTRPNPFGYTILISATSHSKTLDHVAHPPTGVNHRGLR